MTFSVPLSSEVFVATDAQGSHIFTSEVVVKSVSISYESNVIYADCSVPHRSDIIFTRQLDIQDGYDAMNTSLFSSLLASDIVSNFPSELGL